MAKTFSVHLLDVGDEKYGDAILCEFGKTAVLIDGAHPGDHRRTGRHPSIPEQLEKLLGRGRTHEVGLLIVSHAHQDHVGCLPRLVRDDIVRAESVLLVDPDLAFPSGPDAFAGVSDAVRRAAAAIREEYMPPDMDRDALERFLADAVRLEDEYREMIEALAAAGSRVHRYSGRALPALEVRFRSIGLRILGPSSRQMSACSDALDSVTRGAVAAASEAIRTDAAADAVDLYRHLLRGASDAIDAGRSGAAVNLQSIVTRFRYGGRSLLFSGDMQLVSGHPNDTVATEVERLIAKIRGAGPYDFVKLGHHGSGNAFSEDILGALGGTKDFGICAGERSTAHPGRDVLDLLDAEPGVRWARTDRNGLSTFRFGSGNRPRITVADGERSDPRPNSDLAFEVVAPGTRPARAATGGVERVAGPGSVVEVTTTVAGERTTVTIEVRPAGASAVPGPRADRTILPALRVADGRRPKDLVFLTARDALAAKISDRSADHLLAGIRAAGYPVLDAVSHDPDPDRAASLVRDHARRHPGTRGVVILGGYDVVPSQRVDCLPSDVRDDNTPNDDPDDFVVWSDDVYGELGGDPLPEIAVSRIPDGRSADLMFAAVQAGGSSVGSGRSGIRNVQRPFATEVYRPLPGSGDLLVSAPTTFDVRPRYSLEADRVYLMLHGDYTDGRRLRGEDDGSYPVAMDVTNVPERCGPVVLCGACWGALIVDQPAGRLAANETVVAHKDLDGSVALSFLARGVTAFVGCTGAHYSPTVEPFGYYGGPLHAAFWRSYAAGLAPAEALLQAKRDFAGGMPHGRETPGSVAIEFKILRLFTSLGLGW